MNWFQFYLASVALFFLIGRVAFRSLYPTSTFTDYLKALPRLLQL